MKVLVATPYLFPHGGGLERYAHAISERLAADGHDVVHLGHTPVAVDDAHGSLRQVGVTPRWRLSNTPISLDIMRRAREVLREGVDVVSVHTPVPGAAEMVAWAARRENVPYALTYHAGRLEAPAGPLSVAAWTHRNTLERSLIGGASARIAVSSYVAEHVYGARPSTIVPPGVDTTRFRPVTAAVPGRILFVGPVDRAYLWKGFETLFEAFVQLAREHPDAHLRVVGKGDLVESYQQRARDAQLAHRVSFAGRVGDEDLPLEYSRASVLVLPSTSPAESFGMVLAEANACARPVIGSRVGGIPCFVDEGVNGLLSAPGDARELAANLGKILGDEGMAAKMGEAGRLKVKAEHRWPALAQQTAAVLEAARASRGRRRSYARSRAT